MLSKSIHACDEKCSVVMHYDHMNATNLYIDYVNMVTVSLFTLCGLDGRVV